MPLGSKKVDLRISEAEQSMILEMTKAGAENILRLMRSKSEKHQI